MIILTNKELIKFLGKKRIRWIHENAHKNNGHISEVAARYYGRIMSIEEHDSQVAWERVELDIPMLDAVMEEDLNES